MPSLSRQLSHLSLGQWLERIQQIHPLRWDLGLTRVKAVAERLGVLQPAKRVILIAGTNGKGSTCECIAQLCRTMGISYGKTTSPFLLSYNEQFEINGHLASDQQIISAFERIEIARADITLTYFEFSALVAFILFAQAELEIAIVEIGLGGRLDAMNVLVPALSIVTHIDLEHQEYLGDTREKIGSEKAGILRAQTPALIIDDVPPSTLLTEVYRLNCNAVVLGQNLKLTDDLVRLESLGLCATLPPAWLHPSSRAGAIAALWMLGYRPGQWQIDKALTRVSLTGRFQMLEHQRQDACYRTILDVAHNPNAAQRLANLLNKVNMRYNHGVIAIYADKDIEGVFRLMSPLIKTWHLCDLGLERAASLERLQSAIPARQDQPAHIRVYGSARLAYDGAIAAARGPGKLDGRPDAVSKETVLVFGCFPLVADVLGYLGDSAREIA